MGDRSWDRMKTGKFNWRRKYKGSHCLCFMKSLHHKLLEARIFGKLPLCLPVCCCKWDTGLDPARLFLLLCKIFFGQDKRLLGRKTRLGNNVTECFQYSGKNGRERSTTVAKYFNSKQCLQCSSQNVVILLVPVVTLVSCHVLLITLLSETCSEVLLCRTIRACSLCVSSNKSAGLSNETHSCSF